MDILDHFKELAVFPRVRSRCLAPLAKADAIAIAPFPRRGEMDGPARAGTVQRRTGARPATAPASRARGPISARPLRLVPGREDRPRAGRLARRLGMGTGGAAQ